MLEFRRGEGAAHWFYRRTKMASGIELVLYYLFATYTVVRELYPFSSLTSKDVFDLIEQPRTLFAFGMLFIGYFSFILTGSTPIVNRLSRYSASRVVDERGVDNLLDSGDDVERAFKEYLQRSGDAAKVAQRRPNALLFAETIIALVGLVFFIYTLPGSTIANLLTESTGTASVNVPQDVAPRLLEILPRILMLVFIQVLAGFFLRQYRSSMEEFRYYEAVLRHREAQYLSYIMRRSSGDKKSLQAFASEILTQREIGRLSSGETTTVIEAHRHEVNEFASLYERIAELMRRSDQKLPNKSDKSNIDQKG
jgi:hypothetical protein